MVSKIKDGKLLIELDVTESRHILTCLIRTSANGHKALDVSKNFEDVLWMHINKKQNEKT